MSTPNLSATEIVRKRYQRIAPFYDLMENLAETRYRDWRRRLWTQVKGPRVLEVGVGTGKNMPYYPQSLKITAIDLTPGMLEQARRKARNLQLDVELHVGDVQVLDYPDASFDTVVATFVFCSVPDPILGLREVKRVIKPGGTVLLLEHVRSENPVMGRLMDVLDPLTVLMMGLHINRRTVQNIEQAGMKIDRVENLGIGDIFKMIIAKGSVNGAGA